MDGCRGIPKGAAAKYPAQQASELAAISPLPHVSNTRLLLIAPLLANETGSSNSVKRDASKTGREARPLKSVSLLRNAIINHGIGLYARANINAIVLPTMLAVISGHPGDLEDRHNAPR
jgi:hypothetical protein